jgi:chemotaxis signal transduction protein
VEEYLTFYIDGSKTLYGVELRTVLEVSQYSRVTPFRIGKETIIGVINRNGEAIPLFDLISDREECESERLSILILQGEFSPVSIVVKEVLDISYNDELFKKIDSDSLNHKIRG